MGNCCETEYDGCLLDDSEIWDELSIWLLEAA